MSDASGEINLHSLNVTRTLKIQKFGDSKIGLGFSNSPKCIMDGDSVSTCYSNVQTGRFLTVCLNCNEGVRNKPYFQI